MATNFNENSIVSRGGFKPSSKDTPLDIRTRVETEQDIYEIPNPYIGMIVYVKDTGKRFEILTLKEVDTGLTTKNVVDTYKQFTVDLEEYAKIEDVPTKVSELENDKGYLVNQDISGKADIEDVPTKVSELENDRGYATERFVNSEIETINNTMNSNMNTINTEIDNINTDLIGVSENIEGSAISVDSKDGYLKDIEILGNTVQNQDNLADIRSVGDKLENQELYEIPVLSTGKNVFNNKDYGIFKAGSSACTIVHNEITDTYEMTYSGTFTYAILDLTKNLHDFEGKTLLTSCKYSNSNSSAKFSIYLQGIDKEGKIHYFNASSDGYVIPKDTLTTLNLRVYSNNSNVNLSGVFTFTQIQIEEGTQVTPYEPYQEDKLTILSPVQLEKVGDVADRIICKGGVWGVEKNIGTHILNGSNLKQYFTKSENTFYAHFSLNKPALLFKNQGAVLSTISNKYAYNTKDEEHCYIEQNLFAVYMSNNKYPQITSIYSLTEHFNLNPAYIKYVTQPTFIPLPHDQQIKLRTFANKTNISFGCEIEPTLKASVPKSIGATVNTHSEQIDNLYDEIDKIKKLEESTASTVTTESDFTTVTETSNGYFEDVKLEGKTLVNLCTNNYGKVGSAVFNMEEVENGYGYTTTEQGSATITNNTSYKLKDNTVYTAIFDLNTSFKSTDNNNKASLMLGFYGTSNGTDYTYAQGGVNLEGDYIDNYVRVVKTITTTTNCSKVVIGNHVGSNTGFIRVKNLMLFEGDLTANPPSGYIEGLKSVGQDVDEISVVSISNGIVYENIPTKKGSYASTTGAFDGNTNATAFDFLEVVSEVTYRIITNKYTTLAHRVCFYDKNKKFIKSQLLNNIPSEFKVDDERVKYVTGHFATSYDTELKINICIKDSIKTSQSNKKPLLYYNNETQTWEKPVLRQWDSIEKHSDGKYYYHKRSGEVVLNGSENWALNSKWQTDTLVPFYCLDFVDRKPNGELVFDRFSFHKNVVKSGYECAGRSDDTVAIYVNVLKSRLSTQDVAGFKAWLQANPTTVVYQLAEEKVYECTDLDLITYADETNLLVKSGVLNPKVTLKVHQNITNIITILQNKVSVLENMFIQGLKQVLAGDMQSLAYMLYPEDFENIEQSIGETSLGEQQDDPTDE